MINLLDVLHRLIESKPMSEVEQAAAHDIVSASTHLVHLAVGAVDQAEQPAPAEGDAPELDPAAPAVTPAA